MVFAFWFKMIVFFSLRSIYTGWVNLKVTSYLLTSYCIFVGSFVWIFCSSLEIGKIFLKIATLTITRGSPCVSQDICFLNNISLWYVIFMNSNYYFHAFLLFENCYLPVGEKLLEKIYEWKLCPEVFTPLKLFFVFIVNI